MAHIYDDFFVQVMLIILASITIGFIIDVIFDPFLVTEE